MSELQNNNNDYDDTLEENEIDFLESFRDNCLVLAETLTRILDKGYDDESDCDCETHPSHFNLSLASAFNLAYIHTAIDAGDIDEELVEDVLADWEEDTENMEEGIEVGETVGHGETAVKIMKFPGTGTLQ